MNESVYGFRRGKQIGLLVVFAFMNVGVAHIALSDHPFGVQDLNGMLRLFKLLAPYVAVAGFVMIIVVLVRMLRGPVRVSDAGVYNPLAFRRALRFVPWGEVAEIVVEPQLSPTRLHQLVLVLHDGRRSSITPLELIVDPEGLKRDVQDRFRGFAARAVD